MFPPFRGEIDVNARNLSYILLICQVWWTEDIPTRESKFEYVDMAELINEQTINLTPLLRTYLQESVTKYISGDLNADYKHDTFRVDVIYHRAMTERLKQ